MIVFDQAYNHYHQFALWSNKQVFFVTRLKKDAVYTVIELNRRGYRKEGNSSIILDMDMPVRLVKSHEKVEANKNRIAIERGPLVYCAEQVDNPEGVLNMKMNPNQNFQYGYDNEVLNGLGVLKGSVLRDNNAQPFDFKSIPYYAWSHRGVGEMAVWFSLVREKK